jgi:hypothetical protein
LAARPKHTRANQISAIPNASQNPDLWKSFGQQFIDAKYAARIAEKDDNCQDDIRLIDARAPRQSPFGAHIIKKQKQRDAGRESRGEADHERDPDIYLCDDNERSESRTVRGDEGIKKVLIPGIAILRREF